MISRIRLWMLTNSLWVLRQKCHIWWCFCILANCSRTHSPDMIQIRRAHILDRPYKLRSEHKWTKSNEHRIKEKNEIYQIWFHFFISAKSHEKLDTIKFTFVHTQNLILSLLCAHNLSLWMRACHQKFEFKLSCELNRQHYLIVYE